MIHDSWSAQASHRLRQHCMRASLNGKDYAPDTNYEQLKCGHVGPHSVAIAGVLQRWAEMWAQDMREFPEGNTDAQWATNMREADAEIDRYMANNKLTRAA